MAVRVRPRSRLMSDDLPTFERPENATCFIPRAVSGCACPTCPMAPENSTDLIRMGARLRREYGSTKVREYDGTPLRAGGSHAGRAGARTGRNEPGRPVE